MHNIAKIIKHYSRAQNFLQKPCTFFEGLKNHVKCGILLVYFMLVYFCLSRLFCITFCITMASSTFVSPLSTSAFDVQHFQMYTYFRLLLPCTLEHSEEYESAQSHLFIALKEKQHKRLILDATGMVEYDSFLVVWVAGIKRFCAEESIALDVQGMTEQMYAFISLLEKPLLRHQEPEPEPTSWHRYVESVGTAAMQFGADARAFIEFLGEFAIGLVNAIFRPSTIRWRDFPAHLTKAGVGALPIVALIGFLMGVIVGYQGAMQLAQFGAEVYLADMVAISMARELAPLMTAIIVAGRSGAAFAAEIGTMQVSEEIDALKTMGFNVMRFLVLPRVLAVTAVMPLLVLFSDLAGMLGGLLIGTTVLKISVSGYLNETKYALTYAHLLTGLSKSLILGMIISLVGCMRGLQVRGGAESVGHFTTAAVVTGIFLIILADAVFTMIFQALGV